MYAILGEDDSDVETLDVVVRRLANNPRLSIKRKGYEGCAEMLNKGKRQIQAYADLGCEKFVIAYDSDGDEPRERYQEVMRRIVEPAGLEHPVCIVIPVEEIEAWILADLEAIARVCTSWRCSIEVETPESIASPKEYLELMVRKCNKKPLYSHSTHNKQVAKYLRLDLVAKRCPSFRPLVAFVQSDGG